MQKKVKKNGVHIFGRLHWTKTAEKVIVSFCAGDKQILNNAN